MFAFVIAVMIGLIGALGVWRGAVPPVPLLWHAFLRPTLWLRGRLDRPGRSLQDVIFRGFLVIAAALSLSALLYFLYTALKVAATSFAAHALAEGLFLGLWMSAFAIPLFCLQAMTVPKDSALEKLSALTDIEIRRLDDSGRYRFCILIAVLLFTRAFIAPLFWFWFLGLDALFILMPLSICAFSLGRYGYDSGLATLIRAADRLITLVPEILSAALVVLASLMTPGWSLRRSIRGVFALGKSPKSLQGGWPLHLVAHAAGLVLGGPLQSRDSRLYAAGWVGPSDATARLERESLCKVAFGLGVMMLLGLLVFIFLFLDLTA